MKKFLAYTAILLILSGTAWLAQEIRKTGEPASYSKSPVVVAAPVKVSGTGGNFAKPTSGGLMNSSELAWILREKLTLDIMERMVTGGPELDEYNRRAREYNALAVTIEYKESDMTSARRLVEGMKIDITRDAVAETMSLAMPIRAMSDQNIDTVWRIQKLLSLFGYYAGAINGEENEGTVSAVKMYELKSGSPITGRIDKKLAETLTGSWIARNTPADVSLGK